MLLGFHPPGAGAASAAFESEKPGFGDVWGDGADTAELPQHTKA